jgi:hypothetical protein
MPNIATSDAGAAIAISPFFYALTKRQGLASAAKASASVHMALQLLTEGLATFEDRFNMAGALISGAGSSWTTYDPTSLPGQVLGGVGNGMVAVSAIYDTSSFIMSGGAKTSSGKVQAASKITTTSGLVISTCAGPFAEYITSTALPGTVAGALSLSLAFAGTALSSLATLYDDTAATSQSAGNQLHPATQHHGGMTAASPSVALTGLPGAYGAAVTPVRLRMALATGRRFFEDPNWRKVHQDLRIAKDALNSVANLAGAAGGAWISYDPTSTPGQALNAIGNADAAAAASASLYKSAVKAYNIPTDQKNRKISGIILGAGLALTAGGLWAAFLAPLLSQYLLNNAVPGQALAIVALVAAAFGQLLTWLAGKIPGGLAPDDVAG